MKITKSQLKQLIREEIEEAELGFQGGSEMTRQFTELRAIVEDLLTKYPLEMLASVVELHTRKDRGWAE